MKRILLLLIMLAFLPTSCGKKKENDKHYNRVPIEYFYTQCNQITRYCEQKSTITHKPVKCWYFYYVRSTWGGRSERYKYVQCNTH